VNSGDIGGGIWSGDIWSGHTPPADSGTAPQLTAYPVPGGNSGNAAVLILPGGGYAGQAPHESEPVARWLGSLGIAAFVLNYRVRPDRHPAPLLDAKRAMRFLRRHSADFGIDPDRLGVLGFSAGGHLAATLSVDVPIPDPALDEIEEYRSRPDLAVLCYPVISFVEYPKSGSMANLLGPDPDPRLATQLSAELHVDSSTPPSFLWHTADDEAVDPTNSLLFARSLAAHSVPFELHVFPRGRHGLGLAQEDAQVAQWTTLCATWLAAHSWTVTG
jgi:acetyl esterase/lipase